jgi:hypothetical protein
MEEEWQYCLDRDAVKKFQKPLDFSYYNAMIILCLSFLCTQSHFVFLVLFFKVYSTPSTSQFIINASEPFHVLFFGLTNGASYVFSVSATNIIGKGPTTTSGPVVPGISYLCFDVSLQSLVSRRLLNQRNRLSKVRTWRWNHCENTEYYH